MADEPSEPIDRVIDAHECNGDREGLACTDDSHSDAAIIDGATEMDTSKLYLRQQLSLPHAYACQARAKQCQLGGCSRAG